MQGKIVMILMCGLLLNGCGGGQDEQSAKSVSCPHLILPNSSSAVLASPASTVLRSEHLQPAAPSSENSGLKKMGVEVEPGRIIIDTRRARSYLDALGRQLERGIHQGIQKTEQNISRESDWGIRISSEKVEIDLNKTRHFMQQWIEAMRIFGEEVNRSLAPLP